MKREFRVVSIENGSCTEDHHPVETAATTERGFLRVFYARWPHAPRGEFTVVIDADGAATVFHHSGARSAKFIPVQSSARI